MSESGNSSALAASRYSQCDELAAAVLRYCEANHFQNRRRRIADGRSTRRRLRTHTRGASKVFLGWAVTYDIRAKAKILGVNADLLAREGAVHPEVARQMAADTGATIP